MTHKAAAKFTVAKSTLADRLQDRERGATALEYIGMLVVAAMLVVAIWGAINTANPGQKVTTLVNEIFSGKGGE